MGECLSPKQAQLVTMHSYDLQTKVIQSKGWLSAIVSCSMAKINDLCHGSLDQRKVRGLVPCVVKMAIKLKYCNTPYSFI